MRPLLLLALICLCLPGMAQQSDGMFRRVNQLSKDQHAVVSQYESFELNKTRLEQFLQAAPETEFFSILFEGKQLTLELTRNHRITAPHFITKTQQGSQESDYHYQPGLFYNGHISGSAKSFVALSFFNNQVMGLISDEKSNIVLGAVENKGVATSDYMLYREKDLLVPNPNSCFTQDDLISQPTLPNAAARQNRTAFVGQPVELYFECDYAFYQNKGSNVDNVINYVLGFFNGVAQLYENENIQVQVSQINVWTGTDPYTSYSTTTALLPVFAANMANSSYVGDYAHFLSTRNLGGGVAYRLDAPCATTRQYRTAVSYVMSSYSTVPTYSWTVEVVTHETGHNLGSPHTHWCGWNGGAIDNCYPVESVNGNSCSPGPAPTNGGTIMSYCHLASYGINFNNGFGQQPGDKIRSVVGAATCLGNCKMVATVTSVNATCGLNNASATVTPANGTGNYSYAWSNGQTTSTLSNVGAGTYYVTINDGTCQLMKQVVLTSSAGINTTLTPVGNTAAYCAGGNVELAVINNPSYTYKWYKDNVLITGATSYNYLANSPGNYYVTISSGSNCSGTTRTIQVVQTTGVVSAAITPSGKVSVCNGSSVVLTATQGTGYAYQWFNNGTAITGANLSTYTTTAAGLYSVKVTAGSSCSATSQTVEVAVLSVPVATLTIDGSLSFCSGAGRTLTANGGTGLTYSWYKDNTLISGANQQTYQPTATGAYKVEVSNGSCATQSSTISLSVFPSPTITLTPAVATILKGDSVTVNATGAEYYNWSSFGTEVSRFTTSLAVFQPAATKTFTITGTNMYNCNGSAPLTITVIGCGKVSNVTSTLLGSTAAKISWQNPAGATADSLQYRVAGTTTWTNIYTTATEYTLTGLQKATNYEYRLIPLCGASVNVASGIFTFTTPEFEDGIYVKVMPNPASKVATIEIINSTTYDLQLSLYSAAGSKVMELPKQNLPAGAVTRTINVAGLSNGTYFIRLDIGGQLMTRKLLVQH